MVWRSQSLGVGLTPSTSPKWSQRQKPDLFLLTGFKRSQFIFPLALHGFLNCLVLVVERGILRFKHNIGWGLSFLTAAVSPWGGSCLYHLCFAQAQLFLLSVLTGYLLMLRIFDVHTEPVLMRRGNRRGNNGTGSATSYQSAGVQV